MIYFQMIVILSSLIFATCFFNSRAKELCIRSIKKIKNQQ